MYRVYLSLKPKVRRSCERENNRHSTTRNNRPPARDGRFHVLHVPCFCRAQRISCSPKGACSFIRFMRLILYRCCIFTGLFTRGQRHLTEPVVYISHYYVSLDMRNTFAVSKPTLGLFDFQNELSQNELVEVTQTTFTNFTANFTSLEGNRISGILAYKLSAEVRQFTTISTPPIKLNVCIVRSAIETTLYTYIVLCIWRVRSKLASLNVIARSPFNDTNKTPRWFVSRQYARNRS